MLQMCASFGTCYNAQCVLILEHIAQYFASIKLRETIICFLDFSDIRELPKNIQYSLIYLLVSGHVAQSESENALSYRVEDEGKNKP